MFRTALFAAALAGLSSIPATASAQWGHVGGFGGFGNCGFGGFNGCGNGGFGGCGFGGFNGCNNGGFGNCGFGGVGFVGGSWLAGTTYLRPQFPPYYALNPPVYYSHMITARHYGASPYAWLPGMSPITYLPPRGPMFVKNPNAQGAKPGDPRAVASTEPQPLLIENPFVRLNDQSKSIAATQPIENPFFASVNR